MNQKADDSGALLIGIDTKKPEEVLYRAYNDAAGATAAFNLNLLKRIKNELDAEIDVGAFYHEAFYKEQAGRIEMHLYSHEKQAFSINGNSFHFEKGESIHTENSYKYTVVEFQSMAKRAGWIAEKIWQDEDNYFSIHFLRN